MTLALGSTIAFMICLTVATGVAAGTSGRAAATGRAVRALAMMQALPDTNRATLTRNSHCTIKTRERAIYISLPLPFLRRLVPERPAILGQAGRDQLERQIGFVAVGLHLEIARIPRRLHGTFVRLFRIRGVVDDRGIDVHAPFGRGAVGAGARKEEVVAVLLKIPDGLVGGQLLLERRAEIAVAGFPARRRHQRQHDASRDKDSDEASVQHGRYLSAVNVVRHGAG